MCATAAPWWKQSVVYQIYPQSFQDSNDDGIGDLCGIIQRLDYLKTLGVDVLWLNPIYESPLVDNGYDIADYQKINPMYGTMEDFRELLEKAHERGIRIVMDMVINHTSTEHRWFQESKKSKDNPYSDYYIWKDPKPDGSAPNNWGSTFGGPAWEYVPERNQYYLHCFAIEQADLNWESETVRQDIYDQLRFWLDLGVDGFRFDVISLISKDQSFPDNNGEYVYTKSYYAGCSNGPRVHEFLHELHEQVLDHYETITVGETPNTNSAQALLFTNPERKELDMVFQFEHMHLDYGKYGKFSLERVNLADLKENLSKWEHDLEQGWNSLYWNNHDQPRAVSRFGDENYPVESAKMLGTLLHGMKGTPYIYMGEELGLKNTVYDSLDEYQDIETRYFIENMKEAGENPEFIRQVVYNGSRDNARAPIPWNDQKPYYGFSNHKPWLNFSKETSANVETALANPQSVFYHYQKLIALRKQLPAMVDGTYTLLAADHPQVYAYRRSTSNQDLVILCSFAPEEIPFELDPKESRVNPAKARLVLSNLENSPHTLEGVHRLRPYEALIYCLDKEN